LPGNLEIGKLVRNVLHLLRQTLPDLLELFQRHGANVLCGKIKIQNFLQSSQKWKASYHHLLRTGHFLTKKLKKKKKGGRHNKNLVTGTEIVACLSLFFHFCSRKGACGLVNNLKQFVRKRKRNMWFLTMCGLLSDVTLLGEMRDFWQSSVQIAVTKCLTLADD